jgi:hypothetical protein
MTEIPNVALHLPNFEHVNLQRGVDAYLAEHSPEASWFGISGTRYFNTVIDMLAESANSGSHQLGAVDYTTVATGPSTSTEAVQIGLVRTSAPDGTPVVLGIQGAQDDHHEERCHLQVLAADRTTAATVRDEIERLMREHDIFRGQVLSFGMSEHHGNQLLTLLPRPTLRAEEVVLPEGLLASIERHVVRTAEQTAVLRRYGQHLKRGLLLYGPPGTGKTHTVRYLLSRLPECTVFVLSGIAMIKHLRATTALARRLAPSVIVVEDVDLIAQHRDSMEGNPVLFELLNEMDGIGSEADVTFVLTTNRVDTMEEALTPAPGPRRPRGGGAEAGHGVPRAPAAAVRVGHPAGPAVRELRGRGDRGRHGVVHQGTRAPRGPATRRPGRTPGRDGGPRCPHGADGRTAHTDQKHPGRPLTRLRSPAVRLWRSCPCGIPPWRKPADSTGPLVETRARLSVIDIEELVPLWQTSSPRSSGLRRTRRRACATSPSSPR